MQIDFNYRRQFSEYTHAAFNFAKIWSHHNLHLWSKYKQIIDYSNDNDYNANWF